jgi:hypothetical protein
VGGDVTMSSGSIRSALSTTFTLENQYRYFVKHVEGDSTGTRHAVVLIEQ